MSACFLWAHEIQLLGVPKVRGSMLGVLALGIIISLHLHWGRPILGNYHSFLRML